MIILVFLIDFILLGQIILILLYLLIHILFELTMNNFVVFLILNLLWLYNLRFLSKWIIQYLWHTTLLRPFIKSVLSWNVAARVLLNWRIEGLDMPLEAYFIKISIIGIWGNKVWAFESIVRCFELISKIVDSSLL